MKPMVVKRIYEILIGLLLILDLVGVGTLHGVVQAVIGDLR